jgi:uncharacterized RDD family membrane protein YckC
MSKRFGPIYAKNDYAGFVRRTIALVLDILLLGALWNVASYGWYYLAPDDWITHRAYRIIDTSWYLACAAYLFGMRLLVRGTLGYRVMGIEYAYMLAERPTRMALAFRAALAPLLLWFFGLDHFWILVDKRRQAWHDKVTGFFVVRRHAQPVATTQMVQRTIHFMLLTFIVWEPINDNSDIPAPAMPLPQPL